MFKQFWKDSWSLLKIVLSIPIYLIYLMVGVVYAIIVMCAYYNEYHEKIKVGTADRFFKVVSTRGPIDPKEMIKILKEEEG